MPCALTSNDNYPDYLKRALREIETENNYSLKDAACSLRTPLALEGCPIIDNDQKIGAFPFCWTTLEDESLVGPGTLYPIGFSLKQVMQLYWTSKQFNHVINSYTLSLLGYACPEIGCCTDFVQCPCLQKCNPIKYKKYISEECFRDFIFSQEDLINKKLDVKKMSNTELIKKIIFNKKNITLYYKNIEYYTKTEQLSTPTTGGECECIDPDTGEVIYYYPQAFTGCNKINQVLTNNTTVNNKIIDNSSIQIDFFKTYCIQNCGQEPENPPIYSPQYILKQDDDYIFYPTIRLYLEDSISESNIWTTQIPSELNGQEILQTSIIRFIIHGYIKDMNIYNIGYRQSEYTCGYDTKYMNNPTQTTPFIDPIFIS